MRWFHDDGAAAITAVGQNLAKQLDAFCASKNFQTAVLLGVGFELGYALRKGWGMATLLAGAPTRPPVLL
jgi:hypothetical protein